jgi:hypothetical protein
MSKTTKADELNQTVNQTGAELAVISKGTPVPDILKKLDEEIAKLKHVAETPYKTTGQLEGFGDLTKETKIPNLIRAFSMIRGKERAYNEAAEDLGLTTYEPFTISGGNGEQWKADIQLRIAVINHKDQLDKLTEYKKKFTEYLSKEDQFGMLIGNMVNDLGLNK